MMPTVSTVYYTITGKQVVKLNLFYLVRPLVLSPLCHISLSAFSCVFSELDCDLIVGDQIVTPSYDPHCGKSHVSGECEHAVAVISAKKMRDYIEGPAETANISPRY